jgi:predicted acylesterase/phospholipase RssA
MSADVASSVGEDRVKLGLALSGGGFRAAFFHIGVLARMAELGLLRRVEVLSTVSGGSILGALYYLHVKRLLESKPDAEVDDRDYVEIVETIAADFFDGVERNLRARTFSSLGANFRMRRPDYSRSDRIGELYDESFYRRFRTEPGERIRMRDLKIGDFDPERDNPGRQAKIPILLLNATVLNDGHAWRFEAVRMGEPLRPAAARRMDSNMVLRRAGYEEMTPKQRDFHLGVAVAASACFPAFPPLAISELYPDDIRVQLVDGGVYDNQGLQGLRDQRCSHLVVSDGGGQMRDEPKPPGSIVTALFRDSSIQADRIRDAQLLDLDRNPKAAVVHLRSGLVGREVPWIDADGNPAPPPPVEEPELLPFGVHRDVQELLSGIRTDLDCFSEIEARSLTCDAYMISGRELPAAAGIAALTDRTEEERSAPKWSFSAIGPLLSNPTPELRKHLKVARSRFFKAAMLNRWLWLWFLIPLAALGALVWLLWDSALTQHVALGLIVLAVVALPLILFLPRLIRSFPPLHALAGLPETVVRRTVWMALPFLPWLVVRFQLAVFDPSFRKRGALSRLSRRG